MEKNKKTYESPTMGIWRGVEREVPELKVQNVRSYVWLQLQHLSLRWRVVRPRMWIFEIRSGEIITWDMLTIVLNYITMNRTGSFRWMSDKKSKGNRSRDTCESVERKETQRIRTATNFFRRSGDPSVDVSCSSVTNVEDFWFVYYKR